MKLPFAAAPHLPARTSVSAVMLQVLLALVPAAIAHVVFFGPGLIFNLLVAIGMALACEALMLRARERPLAPSLGDYSAVLTAVLLAFCLPPLTPWWITATGSAFAIVVAKHLYGGLGFNLFNPAMAGYVLMLVCFPAHLALWSLPAAEWSGVGLSWLQTLQYTLTGRLPDALTIDAITRATPLDAVRAGLTQAQTLSEITAGPAFGTFGGRGWEWINLALIAGGVFMLARGIIRWHIPVAMLVSLFVLATLFSAIDSARYPGPGFHLFAGATLMGAFFIATDPVTAPVTRLGRLIYGAGIGALVFVIRSWGGYPEGVAFAVLLMNVATPLLDRYTQPRVYGQ